jgi:hypothetical protein
LIDGSGSSLKAGRPKSVSMAASTIQTEFRGVVRVIEFSGLAIGVFHILSSLLL